MIVFCINVSTACVGRVQFRLILRVQLKFNSIKHLISMCEDNRNIIHIYTRNRRAVKPSYTVTWHSDCLHSLCLHVSTTRFRRLRFRLIWSYYIIFNSMKKNSISDAIINKRTNQTAIHSHLAHISMVDIDSWFKI